MPILNPLVAALIHLRAVQTTGDVAESRAGCGASPSPTQNMLCHHAAAPNRFRPGRCLGSRVEVTWQARLSSLWSVLARGVLLTRWHA